MNTFIKYIFRMLIFTGIITLLILVVHALKNVTAINLSAIAILLASQIAAFAVLRTISNTNELESRKAEDEKLKANRVLKAYFRHLIKLGEGQINYLDWLIKESKISPLNIKTFNNRYSLVDTSTYDKDMNIKAFINPIEDMLNHDLHKYTDEKTLDFILDLKAQVIEMIHTMKLIEIETKRDQQLKALKKLKLTVNEYISLTKEYI